MANALKRAVMNLAEKALIHEGRVLEIRKWNPATMHELILHLPTTDMTKWKTIPRIKCKVGEFEYRDYSPALWDSQKRQCSVFIETHHQGYGSAWAQNLSEGDAIFYASAHAAPLPTAPGAILCLGDSTTLGHFLALKQLTENKIHPLEAAITLNECFPQTEAFVATNPSFKFILKNQADDLETLQKQVIQKDLSLYASIYIAGHIPMVQGLRRSLKTMPNLRAKIYAHGFW